MIEMQPDIFRIGGHLSDTLDKIVGAIDVLPENLFIWETEGTKVYDYPSEPKVFYSGGVVHFIANRFPFLIIPMNAEDLNIYYKPKRPSTSREVSFSYRDFKFSFDEGEVFSYFKRETGLSKLSLEKILPIHKYPLDSCSATAPTVSVLTIS